MKMWRHFFLLSNLKYCLRKTYNKNIHLNLNKNVFIDKSTVFSCPKRNCSTTSSELRNSKIKFTTKIDSEEFYSVFTPGLEKLKEIFTSRGHEIRIVGGTVRDILSGIRPDDIDISTTATPNEMKVMFREENLPLCKRSGEKFGTFCVQLGPEKEIQVTTLLAEIVRDGRELQIKLANDWYSDSYRRDFTINSMYLGLDGTLYDYFGGTEDLKNKKIKFVGNPEKCIKENFKVILRYFRFYSKIAEHPNDHDPRILQIIQENLSGLSEPSPEIIYSELKKTLTGKHNFDVLKTMIRLGIAPYIGLPKNPELKNLDELQNRSRGSKLHPLTILLSLIENKYQLENFCRKLKLPYNEKKLGMYLLYNRDGLFSTDPLKSLQTFILESDAKRYHALEWVEEVLKYRGDFELLKQIQDWERKIPYFPVSKNTLRSEQFPQWDRQQFNRILLALKRTWINSNFTMTENDLLERLPEILREDSCND